MARLLRAYTQLPHCPRRVDPETRGPEPFGGRRFLRRGAGQPHLGFRLETFPQTPSSSYTACERNSTTTRLGDKPQFEPDWGLRQNTAYEAHLRATSSAFSHTSDLG